MGCLKWILNFFVAKFVFLLLIGQWIGIYALSDMPSWSDDSYVPQIESVVGEPVDRVFLHGESELEVVLESRDEPVYIDRSDVSDPSVPVQFALGYTEFVQMGLAVTGSVWVFAFGLKVVFGALRLIL